MPISDLDLRSVSRVVGSQGGSNGRLRLRPRDRGSKKEGSGTIASVTLDRSSHGRLRLCPRARAGTSLSTEEGIGDGMSVEETEDVDPQRDREWPTEGKATALPVGRFTVLEVDYGHQT
jgi:hypothetical protein